MRTSLWLAILLGVLSALCATVKPASAHNGLPILVVVTQQGAKTYRFTVQLPPSAPAGLRPALEVQGCRKVAAGPVHECDTGLAGVVLETSFAGARPDVPTLLRVDWLSGESRSQLVPAGKSRFALPGQETAPAVAKEYARLGVTHILEGYDHLLFLLCLLLIARTAKRTAVLVTGFTLGHAGSITVVALGGTGPATPPVEAAIALSIVLLAVEIARNNRSTLVWRYPAVIAVLFGLLHGFGFGAALRDLGFPQTELPTALLFFNLGIEAGQLLFVTACAAIYWAVRGLLPAIAPAWLERAPAAQLVAYPVGVVASFWLIERISALA